MNYYRLYDKIISSRKLLNRKKRKRDHRNYVYYESHHIIPKSMGGSNDPDNLVLLTAREHFIAHWLLWKIHKSKEMGCAFGLMSKSRYDLKMNSHKYSACKIASSESMSDYMTGKTKENSSMRRTQALSIAVTLSNKEIFEFWHTDYGYFKGNCLELRRKYHNQNLNGGNLLKVGRGYHQVCKGWVLLENKSNYDNIVYKNKIKISRDAGAKGGKYKHVNNGKHSTRISEDKLEDFFKNNIDYKLGCMTKNSSNIKLSCIFCKNETTPQWFKRKHGKCKEEIN